MTLSHRVVLCADDYGLTAGVSRGILDLARRGRISATSVMSTMAAWPDLAPELRDLKDRIGVGLHLNLTTGAPSGPMPALAPDGRFPALPQLMRQALPGGLRVGEIRSEIERQLDAFERGMGAPPAFIDGHQHVHVLPGIRTALLAVLRERGLAGRVWLRDPSDRLASIARRGVSGRKALVVQGLALGFRRAARRAGFATNDGFSGFSPLDRTDPARVFRGAFNGLGPRPVVMCHPGYADPELRSLDAAVESRPAELAYLSSPAFGDLLAEQQVELVPHPL